MYLYAALHIRCDTDKHSDMCMNTYVHLYMYTYMHIYAYICIHTCILYYTIDLYRGIIEYTLYICTFVYICLVTCNWSWLLLVQQTQHHTYAGQIYRCVYTHSGIFTVYMYMCIYMSTYIQLIVAVSGTTNATPHIRWTNI